MTQPNYIVTYLFNNEWKTEQFEYYSQALAEQIKLSSYGILSTIHETTNGQDEKEYGISRLARN